MCLIRLMRELHDKGCDMLRSLPASGRAPRNREVLNPASCFSNPAFRYLLGRIRSKEKEDFSTFHHVPFEFQSPEIVYRNRRYGHIGC